MKKLGIWLFALLLVADIAVHLNPISVKAQTATVGTFASPVVVSALSGCTAPQGATITFGAAWCFVDTGTVSTSQMYVALNGATTWTAWPPAASSSSITSVVATAPLTATTSGTTVTLTLPAASLKTSIDGLG